MIDMLEKLGLKLEPIATKLTANKTLAAIKDGFIAIMPLLIVGSFAVVLNNVFLNWGEGSLCYSFGIRVSTDFINTTENFKNIGNFIAQGAMSTMSVMISYTIASAYAKSQKMDGQSAGLISLASFFSVLVWNVEGTYSINPADLSSTNVLTAILIAIISAKIFCLIIKKDKIVKMPEGVPKGVIKSFEALVPATIIILFWSLTAFILLTLNSSLSTIISNTIATPLQQIGSEGPLVAFIYVTLSNFLYFFGLHGPNILSFVDATVLTPASITNADVIAQGGTASLIFSKGMLDSLVYIGGGGATLGLIGAILIASNRKGDRAVAKFSLTPALFNINEPLVFGLPIVLNPILFIPFLIIPPILLTTGWIQIMLLNSMGLLVNTGAVLIPWVSPVGIGALLAYQNIYMIFVALIQLGLATLIYLPFVIAGNNSKKN